MSISEKGDRIDLKMFRLIALTGDDRRKLGTAPIPYNRACFCKILYLSIECAYKRRIDPLKNRENLITYLVALII